MFYDTRDSSFNPKKGNFVSFNQDLPIISNDNEVKNTLILTKYKSLKRSDDMIGKISFYISAINSYDGSDVRISKRNRLPSNRLSGFEKGKIGPIDGGDFVGGNYATALNFSTNIPGLLTTVESLDFKYFIDIGNVWGVDYDSSINESNGVRSSTDSNRLLIPVGPMNFSWALPITKESSDKTEVFRFNLGTTF